MKTKKISQRKLNRIIKKHELWLKNPSKGECATIIDMDLSGLNLSHANLSKAYISNTCFDGAIMIKTDMSCAFMYCSSFVNANMQECNLRGPFLWNCDFTSADLRCAKLSTFEEWDIERSIQFSKHPDCPWGSPICNGGMDLADSFHFKFADLRGIRFYDDREKSCFDFASSKMKTEK